MTPQADIDWAKSIEAALTPEQKPLYLEFLGDRPMSQRKTEVEIRDGCILTGLYWRTVLKPLEEGRRKK